MKFFFADSQDYIDPGFDFEREEFSSDRRAQRDDQYAHEYFPTPPYDGLLVSRATVGDEIRSGKYSTSQSLRFRRDGASAYLRYNPEQYGGAIMGDCGAFSYVKEEKPPYELAEMVEYYVNCRFTHAVSIDHVILGYNPALDRPNLFDEAVSSAVPDEWVQRYELTLRNAEAFYNYCKDNKAPFQAIGVAQGWSPRSYAQAVRRLVDTGYDYVALGGMVPLMSAQIHPILQEVREQAPDVQLHLFGFTKADELHQFVKYNITSFDSTSPLLRAFKDDKKNFLGNNRWYTAIRLPQADENNRFKQDILAGFKAQKHLRELESNALGALRAYDKGQISQSEALEAIVEYGTEFHRKVPVRAYEETLAARPWESCSCRACMEAGIEIIVFRGSNRNRRRGFHNLWAFHQALKQLRDQTSTPLAS